MDTPLPSGQTGTPAYEKTTYAYDANGNLIQTTAPATTNGGSNQVTIDTYTATGQLASVTTGSASTPLSTISYCYDPNGDQTAVVYGDGNTPGTSTPCETSSPWVISSSSHPTAASYQTTYSYDSAGELVSTTAPATTSAPSGATTTETYDPAGNTLTRTDPNGVITTWTYTPLNQTSTAAYSGGTAHSVSYGYDANGNKMSMADATGSSSYQYDPFSELTSAVNGANQTVGYGYNQTAKCPRLASYDAWGNPASSGGLTATTPFGYAGGYTDPSGLIYLRARYYDPTTGQFISLDPAISQTLAPYGYADGNTVYRNDPSGLSTYVGVSWYGPTLYMSESLLTNCGIWRMVSYSVLQD